MNPLYDGCKNHSKLLVVAQVFTIKSGYELSKVDYDIIVEWMRNILLEENRLKDNFSIAKSMMKSFDLEY
jgi:hypothetical protein